MAIEPPLDLPARHAVEVGDEVDVSAEDGMAPRTRASSSRRCANLR